MESIPLKPVSGRILYAIKAKPRFHSPSHLRVSLCLSRSVDELCTKSRSVT